MNTEEKRAVKIGFPFGLYFKQLFSANTYARYINPFSFWRRYRIDHLKTCHALNTVRHLENCFQLDSQVVKQTNIGSELDYESAAMNSLFQQARSNTIHISRPRIELKYRGVSYYTRDILNVYIHVVEIDPSTVSSNSFRSPNNSYDANASEKWSSDR